MLQLDVYKVGNIIQEHVAYFYLTILVFFAIHTKTST
jgi:hypothetical protein